MPKTCKNKNQLQIFALQISFSQKETFLRTYTGSGAGGLLTLKSKTYSNAKYRVFKNKVI